MGTRGSSQQSETNKLQVDVQAEARSRQERSALQSKTRHARIQAAGGNRLPRDSQSCSQILFDSDYSRYSCERPHEDKAVRRKNSIFVR